MVVYTGNCGYFAGIFLSDIGDVAWAVKSFLYDVNRWFAAEGIL
jgi:hypothetical protein